MSNNMHNMCIGNKQNIHNYVAESLCDFNIPVTPMLWHAESQSNHNDAWEITAFWT